MNVTWDFLWVAVLCLTSLVMLYRDFARRGITAYNLFMLGAVVIYLVGYMSVYVFPDAAYVLKDQPERIRRILPGLSIFSLFALFGLWKQRGLGLFPGRMGLQDQLRRIRWKPVALAMLAYFAVLAFLVHWDSAPLFNIGRYTQAEVLDARNNFYRGGLLDAMAVFRYVIFYTLTPTFFLMRGLGIRISWWILAVPMFFGLLTLAKTFFVLNTIFYFLGRYLRRGKLIEIPVGVAVLSGGFYAIVSATYALVSDRGFAEVTGVLLSRVIQVPVSLCAIYAEQYSFADGVRSSSYYVLVFGGHFRDLSSEVMYTVFGVSDGRAPAGIVGIAYPNLPVWLHPLYFAFFLGFIYLVSRWCQEIRHPIAKVLLTAVFGMGSCFILLTDPLTAMNSYGLLYLGILALLFRQAGRPASKPASAP